MNKFLKAIRNENVILSALYYESGGVVLSKWKFWVLGLVILQYCKYLSFPYTTNFAMNYLFGSAMPPLDSSFETEKDIEIACENDMFINWSSLKHLLVSFIVSIAQTY